MRAPTLSDIIAGEAARARREGRDYKILDGQRGVVGSGEAWDESLADAAATILSDRALALREDGERVDVNTFDAYACEFIHRGLRLPPNLVASEGFWRWLAVEKFAESIEARHANAGNPARLRNYGIEAPIEANRLAVIWFRANTVYDAGADDPYHLAKRPAHTDFWESAIIRHRYGWCNNLARGLVKFQYRDPSSNKAHLHSTDGNGIRALYRRLQQLHATIAFEYLTDDQIRRILEEKSADLRKA